MSRFIHYFALLFIVFVCAEIRNVLVYQTPYDSEPVNIWSESKNLAQAELMPSTKLL
jgi:hypothetical protein